MIKVAACKEGKTLHEKLRELGTDGIQGPTFYNDETGELMGTKRLHDTTLGQADLEKMGVARIKKPGESRYKKEFLSMSFAPRNTV